MKGSVNCLCQQIGGKKMPALRAYSRRNTQKDNLDTESKPNLNTQVFQWQALNDFL